MSIISNENRGRILGGAPASPDSPSAASAQAPVETAGPVSSLGVGGGSAAPVEVVEAFKRLHAAWLGAHHRSDMNEQMDALATALQLHPHTLAPLNGRGQTTQPRASANP